MADIRHITDGMQFIAGEFIKQAQPVYLSPLTGKIHVYTPATKAPNGRPVNMEGIAIHDINEGDLITLQLDVITHAGTNKDDASAVVTPRKTYYFYLGSEDEQ